MQFKIDHKLKDTLARAGSVTTDHGVIKTPAFVTVGTKATVKALSPADVAALGAQVVLANTYHLYLQPGEKVLRQAGGLHKFMNWQGPTMTDSGGFQVFSLGVAFGTNISKLSKLESDPHLEARPLSEDENARLARIDEDGVTFRSHTDGSEHRFTPERSMEMQHNIGADIIFAFDECTSPTAPHAYQVEAMERTHRWAKRSLEAHKKLEREDPLPYTQALFGIVQGGRHQDLREASAHAIAAMGFAGYGIGGSFDKEDMGTAVRWVNSILPEEQPRHLLGIGDPSDLFDAVENGCDLFDCVAPTRMARNGALYTSTGRINILNTQYRNDFSPIDPECSCAVCLGSETVCPKTKSLASGPELEARLPGPVFGEPVPNHTQGYTRSYIAHLSRSRELLAYRLASIHNLHFIVHLVDNIRKSLFDGNFTELKEKFLSTYTRSI